MRKLDRTCVAGPACLASYKHGRDNWDAVSGQDRAAIRACLEQLQGRLCAYCEGSLDELGQHIEHFQTRNSCPTLTFAWENLFWSCDMTDSCGRFKDNDAGHYDPTHVVNPCVDDPDRFFRFRTDGSIAVRAGLLEHDKLRAIETLRVFNLDPEYGRLRRMRELALKSYNAVEPNIIDALIDFEPAERQAFIIDELARTSRDPFATVIRHFFEDVR